MEQKALQRKVNYIAPTLNTNQNLKLLTNRFG